MSFSVLDPATALIVVDMQRGILALPLAHPADHVLANISALLAAFRERAAPVVLVNVAGLPPGRTDVGPDDRYSFAQDWSALIGEVQQQSGDVLITKYGRSAFTRTGLAPRLRRMGVAQVVVVGIATSRGVESTARDAHEQGFHVSLPVDAMTDVTLSDHEHSIQHVFPRIAETGTTDGLLRLLGEG